MTKKKKDPLQNSELMQGTPGHICFNVPFVLIRKDKYVKFIKEYKNLWRKYLKLVEENIKLSK